MNNHAKKNQRFLAWSPPSHGSPTAGVAHHQEPFGDRPPEADYRLAIGGMEG